MIFLALRIAYSIVLVSRIDTVKNTDYIEEIVVDTELAYIGKYANAVTSLSPTYHEKSSLLICSLTSASMAQYAS